MFRKSKQSLSFGMAILGLLCIVIGITMSFLMNPKKTKQQDITYTITTPTSPDQFLTHTRANQTFALRDRSYFSLLHYHDFSILSPPTWKYNYNDPNTDIATMLANNMSPQFTFSHFSMIWRDQTLSLLSSSPDGYSRLSNTLVNTQTAVMTIIPKPVDLFITYLPERRTQANVSRVGNCIATSEDNLRLYVSYYITDNTESRVYHKDQTSADFPATHLLNFMHILCGAISIFSWDDIALQWVLQSTLQHPFGGRYKVPIPSTPGVHYDYYGERIIPWTMRNYATQTDSYMFTTSAHHNTLITYQDNGTVYHYSLPANFTNGLFFVNETWCMLYTQDAIDIYKWDHQLQTFGTAALQTISCTNPATFLFRDDFLLIQNQIYHVISSSASSSSSPWQIQTTLNPVKFLTDNVILVATDILGQVIVVFTSTSYTIFPIHTMVTKTVITHSNLPEIPQQAQVQFVSSSCFLVIYSTMTAFYCDLYKSSA